MLSVQLAVISIDMYKENTVEFTVSSTPMENVQSGLFEDSSPMLPGSVCVASRCVHTHIIVVFSMIGVLCFCLGYIVGIACLKIL